MSEHIEISDSQMERSFYDAAHGNTEMLPDLNAFMLAQLQDGGMSRHDSPAKKQLQANAAYELLLEWFQHVEGEAFKLAIREDAERVVCAAEYEEDR